MSKVCYYKIFIFFFLQLLFNYSNAQYKVEQLNLDKEPYFSKGNAFDFTNNQNEGVYYYYLGKGRAFGESQIDIYKITADKIELIAALFAPFPYLIDKTEFKVDKDGSFVFIGSKGEFISDIFVFDPARKVLNYYSYFQISNQNLYPEISFFRIDRKNTPLFSGTKFTNGFIFPSYDYEEITASKMPGLTITSKGLNNLNNYNLVEFDDGTNNKPKYFGTALAMSGNSNVWSYYKPSVGGGDKVYIVNHDLATGQQIKYLINNEDFDFTDIFFNAVGNGDFIKIKEKFNGNNRGIYFYYIKDGILTTKIYNSNDFGFLKNGIITLDKNNTLWSFDNRNNTLYNLTLDGGIINKIELGEKFFDYDKIISDLKNDFIYLYRSPDIYNPKALTRISKNSIINITPSFSFSPITPKENETITFKDESTGSPTSWAWDFGDGTSSSIQNPTKKYTKAGIYKVKLTVNKAGATAQSITKEITILAEAAPPPIERSIKIISPGSGAKVSALEPLNIKLELAAGTILATCKVEIKGLTGSLIKSLGNINGALINNFPFSIKDVSTGEYWLKVSGLSQPNLKDSVKIQVQNVKFTPGVTLVTHGFQPAGGGAVAFTGNGSVNDFVLGNSSQIGMCAAIKKRVELEGGKATIYQNDPLTSTWMLIDGEGKATDEIILFYNWATLSNDKKDGALESAADNLFAMLARPYVTITKGQIPSRPLSGDIPLHFIGHSRGNILLLQVLHRMMLHFPNKKLNHFTLLDPHPAIPMNDINQIDQNSSLPGVYGNPRNYPNEPSIILPSNVLKSDVFYRQAPLQYEPIIDLALFQKEENNLETFKAILFLISTNVFGLTTVDWEKLNGYYGNFSGIPVLNASKSTKLNEEEIRKGTSNKLPHSGVHEWYRGTILPLELSFESGERGKWYSSINRKTEGYNLSRVGGNFENLRNIDNGEELEAFNNRTFDRSGVKPNSIFNQNFKYFTNGILDALTTKGGYYGWAGLGGEIPAFMDKQAGSLKLEKPKGTGHLATLVPLIKHNFMYFNEEDNFLCIKIDLAKPASKINITFYNITKSDASLTIRTPKPDTYFIKIPENLKGDIGNFSISLDNTSGYDPVLISKVYTSATETSDGQIVTLDWRNEENSLKANVLGVVADGTSRILIKVGNENQSSLLNTNRAAKVLVSLKDIGGDLNTTQYIGSLKPIDNLSQLTSPLTLTHGNEIKAVSSQKINNFFYFDYQAPTDFGRTYEGMDDTQKSERSVVLEITLLDAANQEIQRHTKNISIVRPPLMLAHGLGGKGVGLNPGEAGESTWRKFRYTKGESEILFRDSDLFLSKRDINLLPTASFDANSDVLLGKSTDSNMQNESFDAMIKRMNDMGYACAKVDYVAHSMGGSVLRNTLDKLEYKNPKNYNQGYVNKFITICTPHQGSPLGDIMSEFTPYLSFSNDAFLSFLTPNLTGFVTGYFNRDPKAVEAVKNLSIREENGGVRFNSAEIKNHMIFGNYVRKFEYDYTTLFASLSKDLKIGVSALDHLTLAIALAAVRKFDKCNCEKEKNEVIEIINRNKAWQGDIKSDKIELFEKYILKGEYIPSNVIIPTSNLIPEFYDWASRRVNPSAPEFYNYSDMVVSVLSQTAGKVSKFESSEIIKPQSSLTVFDDITHNFDPIKAAQSLKVGNRVLQLLNSPLNSEYFSSTISASPVINSPISCQTNCSLSGKFSELDFSISPNPTQNDFELNLTEMGISKEYQINIFDEKGNLIHNQSIINNCCPIITPMINRPGVYSVNITSDQGIKTKKIIINK